MLSAFKIIAQKNADKKGSNNDQAPWGTINNYIKVLENKAKEKKIGCTILFNIEPNDLSSITDDNFLSTANHDPGNIISNTPYSNTASSNTDDDSDASTNTSSKSDSSSPNVVGGHPKGTTIANSLDCKA
jgi:hypothetical protein